MLQNIFLVETKKLHIHAEFQIKITITSTVIKEKPKFFDVCHNPKFCLKFKKIGIFLVITFEPLNQIQKYLHQSIDLLIAHLLEY